MGENYAVYRARSAWGVCSDFLDAHGKWGPIVTVTIALATLLTCLELTVSGGHAEGLWLPFISLTNVWSPERHIYVAGLSSASCGIVVSVAYGKRTFIVHVEPQHRRLAQTSMIAGLAAALGIFWQALIPLQHDIGEVIRGRAEISPQSMLHQSGAMVLFMAGYIHMITMNYLLLKSSTLPSPKYSKAIKVFLTTLTIAPIGIAVLRHPTAGTTSNADEMSWGAVGQWVAVLSLLLYFGSYHFEFVLHLRAHSSREMESSRVGSKGPGSIASAKSGDIRASEQMDVPLKVGWDET